MSIFVSFSKTLDIHVLVKECRCVHQYLVSVCRVVGWYVCTRYLYSNDAVNKQQCLRTERSTEPLFLRKEVTKINLIADHVHVSLTVKHNHHRSNKADRLLTVATYHEQETNDHHGHFIQGHLIHDHTTHVEVIHHVEVIAVGAAAGGGTGRLLHLSG